MREEGAVRKKITKTWNICFCWHFCTFEFICAVPPPARPRWRRAWDLIIFPLKTFAMTPKTYTSAQWDFLHGPKLSWHTALPSGEHPHACQFVGLWVICLKVILDIPASLPNNLLAHRMGRTRKLSGFHRSMTHDLGISFMECFEKHMQGWNMRSVNWKTR